MRIKETGRSYSLPFINFRISNVYLGHYTGFDLSNPENSSPEIFISLHMEFEFIQFNQSIRFSPDSPKAFKKMIDLIDRVVIKAEASKTGDLYLTFDDNSELRVFDSQYESWTIYKINKERVINSWIIGGVGSISYWDFHKT